MKTTKTTTKKSDSKKTAPKKGSSKSAPAKVESKPKKTSKKSTAKELPKTEVVTETKAAPVESPAMVEAAPPTSTTPTMSVEVPGKAISGAHLAKCLRYVLSAIPKEEGEVTFDLDDMGCPILSGHDQRRVHVAYLAEKAACELMGRVPRDEAADLADILEGVRGPRVRISGSGRVIVSHGTAQPDIHFAFAVRRLVATMRIPSQSGRSRAAVPLRLNTAHLAKAVKWPNAISSEFQASDGIAFLTITDQESGTLLARAVIAEDGLDLYPEDDRQTEIPGSRTAPGAYTTGVEKAVDDIKRSIPAGTQMTIAVSGKAPVTLHGAGPREEEVTIEGAEPLRGAALEGALGDLERWAADANASHSPKTSEPVEAAPVAALAFPEPDTKPVVVVIPEAIWDELSPDALETLHLPPGATARVPWFINPDRTESNKLTADEARLVGRALAALGLICEDHSAGRRHGIECSVWTIGRAAPKGGA